MDEDTKKFLGGAAFLGGIAAVVVCGVGLFMMGLEGSISSAHFVRLGMATAGAAMVGAIGGIFMVGGMFVDEEKKKKESQQSGVPSVAAITEDRPAQS